MSGCCEMGAHECDENVFGDVFADRCLVAELRRLRDGGIRTLASCCGHGKTRPVIAVDRESEQKMTSLGYKFEENAFGVKEFFAKSECPGGKDAE